MLHLSRNVISIGYGRHLFTTDNPERRRMELCAKEADVFHMIIFTHAKDGLQETKGANNLILHPTNSRYRPLMIIDSFLIAAKIIRHSKNSWIVTTQDPFEAGIVGYFLKLFCKVRLVVQEHGDVFSTDYWRRESVGNFFRYYGGLFILRYADSVRVVGERTKEDFKKRGITHVTQLPVAVDVAPFVSAQPDQKVAALFGPDTFVFLSVARFVTQKNLPLMIKSFKVAYLHNPGIRLLLVGSGPLESEIRTLLKAEFVTNASLVCPVQLLSWSDNVPGLMKASDAYLLSSNYEGWGRVLIEALLCQLPIVTTNVGCAHEVIKHKEHGLITAVNDETQLTSAIIEMANNKEFYQIVKTTLKQLDVKTIPGTDLENYGTQWVQTLQ